MDAKAVHELANFIEDRTDLPLDQESSCIPSADRGGDIAAFAKLLRRYKGFHDEGCSGESLHALLKIDRTTKRKIFLFPSGLPVIWATPTRRVFNPTMQDATRSCVVRMLRHLAETGEVRDPGPGPYHRMVAAMRDHLPGVLGGVPDSR